MARSILNLRSISIVSLFWAAVASIEPIIVTDMACNDTACDNSQIDAHEDLEMSAVRVELLQAHKHKHVHTGSIVKARGDEQATTEAGTKTREQKPDVEATFESDVPSVVSKDHNENMCMLCGRPLPERVDREYPAFRKDCCSMSSPKGPNSTVLATPVSKLSQINEAGVVSNGFCQLNFAKSCVDAVANKDYLYWAKSINLNATGSRQNAAWDSRYCRLNGFLEASMVALQHDFHSTQAKADELCRSKYAKYNIDNITFMDMMTAARYDDPSAPTLDEAELLAAWNCAMGDLGCDMALCAYSFCEKASGQGLYDECDGWHPIHGMPSPI